MAVDAITGEPIFGGSHGVGLSNVGSYQSAGTPYITASLLSATQNKGSIVRFQFPRVAKNVTVKVIPTNFVGGDEDTSHPVVISFGEPRDAGGTLRNGKDAYQTNGTNAPLQFTQRHGYSLSFVSGNADNFGVGGESQTFGVRTDHINISVNGFASHVTGAFQIYAELTNIPAARMSDSYITGSGINTL